MIEFDLTHRPPTLASSQQQPPPPPPPQSGEHHHNHHHPNHHHHPHHQSSHYLPHANYHLSSPHLQQSHPPPPFYSEISTPSPAPEVIVSKFSLYPETIETPAKLKDEPIDDFGVPLSPASPGSLILDPLTLKKKKKSHLSRDELNRVCQGGDVTFEPYNESPYMVAIRCLSDRKSLIGYRCEWHACGYMNARVERMLGHIRSQHPDAPPVKKLPVTNTPPSSTRPRSSSSLSTASSLSSGQPTTASLGQLPFLFSPSGGLESDLVGEDTSTTGTDTPTPPPPPTQAPPAISSLSSLSSSLSSMNVMSSESNSSLILSSSGGLPGLSVSTPTPSNTTTTSATPTVICQEESNNNLNNNNLNNKKPEVVSHTNGKLASLLTQKSTDSSSMTPEYSSAGSALGNGVGGPGNPFFSAQPEGPSMDPSGSVYPITGSSNVDDNNNKHKQSNRASLAALHGAGITEDGNNKNLPQLGGHLGHPNILQNPPQNPLQQVKGPKVPNSPGASHFGVNHPNDYFYPHTGNEMNFSQSFPAYQQQPRGAVTNSFSQPPSESYPSTKSHAASSVAASSTTTVTELASSQAVSHGQSVASPVVLASVGGHQFAAGGDHHHHHHHQQHLHPHRQHLNLNPSLAQHPLAKSSSIDGSVVSSLNTTPSSLPPLPSDDTNLITNDGFTMDLDHMLDHDTNSSTGSSGKKFKKIGTGSKNYIGKQNLFQEFLSEDVNKVRDPENRYIIALQKNMKIVGYRCDWPDCEFLTCRKYVMVNHINGKHINQRPFSCPLCSFNFVKRYFLKAHMQKVHKRRISVDCKEDIPSSKKHHHRSNSSSLNIDPTSQPDFYDGPLKRSKSEHPNFGHIPEDIPVLQSQYSLDSSAPPDYHYGYSSSGPGYKGFPGPQGPPSHAGNGGFPGHPGYPAAGPEGFPLNGATGNGGFDDFLTPPSSISSSGSVAGYQQSYVETPMSNSTSTSTFSFLHTPSSSPALSSLSPVAGSGPQSQQAPQARGQNSTPQPPQYTPPAPQAYPHPPPPPPPQFLGGDYPPNGGQFPGDHGKFYPPPPPQQGYGPGQVYGEQFNNSGAYEQGFDTKPYDTGYRPEAGECWNNSGW